MDLQDYWQKKLSKYSQEEWSKIPNIFATQAITYFPPTGYLLDLGAGTGQDTIFFAGKGYQVMSTDLVISEAQKNLPSVFSQNVAFRVMDLSKPLPFSPNTFDIEYCHLSLHFFDTQRTQQLFDEILTTLKPGGIFAVLANPQDDPEVGESEKIGEDLYITPGGLQKRFFSVSSMAEFTSKFETLLLDNHGETHKDLTKTLIRFVGRKPLT